MNATFLLPRLVRTQPLTVMSLPTAPDFRISAILCVFMIFMFLFCYFSSVLSWTDDVRPYQSTKVGNNLLFVKKKVPLQTVLCTVKR
jgi:hypothetical protein